MPSNDQPWWMPLELVERNRFRVLEHLYQGSGGKPDVEIDVAPAAVAGALGFSEGEVLQAVAFLVHARYLDEREGRVCLCRRAVYYLEAGAYQRRTIRD